MVLQEGKPRPQVRGTGFKSNLLGQQSVPRSDVQFNVVRIALGTTYIGATFTAPFVCSNNTARKVKCILHLLSAGVLYFIGLPRI